MKVEQLLRQPLGQKIGGFTLSIKTYKKNWQSGKFWWQQVICMDETGEIPVDVKAGLVYNPIRGRAKAIHVIVAKVQEAEYLGKDRRKLVVDQFSIPSITCSKAEDLEADDWKQHREDEIKSKIRCWLVASYIEGHVEKMGFVPTRSKGSKEAINEWADYVLTGE